MQRGILKHYAHVLPSMFAERVLWQDLPTIGTWGDGTLTIDLMQGTCRLDGRILESLWVVGDLHAWLEAERQKQHDPPDDMQAVLVVTFSKGEHGLTFDCTATVTSGDQVFVDRVSASPGRVRPY
jgi:hypothetical protein